MENFSNTSLGINSIGAVIMVSQKTDLPFNQSGFCYKISSDGAGSGIHKSKSISSLTSAEKNFSPYQQASSHCKDSLSITKNQFPSFGACDLGSNPA